MLGMRPDPERLDIRRSREVESRPDYRKLRRAIESGEVHRIAPGTFALDSQWAGLSPREQHLVRVKEAIARMRSPALLSHFAAASVQGIEILGKWPKQIDVRIPRGSGGRSTGLMRRHAQGVDVDAEDWHGHRITSPAQTALDLVAVLGYTAGVVVLDQVLWERRPGGPLASVDALWDLLDRRDSQRGAARIRSALGSATSLSDSVRESQSRVLIARLGFPEPILQRRFLLPQHGAVRSDFYFPDQDHIGEFDGVGKYLDAELLQGRTPEQALIAEKDRADALARVVHRISRWRTPALREPRLLYDILVADGLPTTKPPPPFTRR